MKAEITHIQNLTFTATIRDHKFFMDTQVSAGGENKGPTPKELLLAGIIGCAGMDVVSLLKKYKMTADSLVITAEAEPRKEHPRIFQETQLVFSATGNNLQDKELSEAVRLSLTKYCGVTAMIADAVPTHYKVLLNGKEISSGTANFH